MASSYLFLIKLHQASISANIRFPFARFVSSSELEQVAMVILCVSNSNKEVSCILLVHCSPGEPWILAFLWKMLDPNHTPKNRTTIWSNDTNVALNLP